MDQATRLLVIILSVTLTVFLIVAIAVLVNILLIVRKVHKVAKKVENLAETAQSVGDFLKRSAKPAAVGKVVSSAFKKARRHNRKRRGENDEENY